MIAIFAHFWSSKWCGQISNQNMSDDSRIPLQTPRVTFPMVNGCQRLIRYCSMWIPKITPVPLRVTTKLQELEERKQKRAEETAAAGATVLMEIGQPGALNLDDF